MSKIIVGTTDTSRVEFRDINGALADPTTVTAEVKKPDGSVTSAPITIVNSAVGVYDFYVATDAAGMWYLVITGSGNDVDKVFEKTICVVRSSTS